MGYKQTRDELEEHLRNQVGFLRVSGESYDSGTPSEAVRLAVVIRILVHGTKASHSLLGQLGLKESLRFIDTAPQWEGEMMPRLSRTILSTSGSARFVPRLDNLVMPPVEKAFVDWWNFVVMADEDGNEFSRRILVLALANKDGGTHVDPELWAEYAALSRSGSLGWVIVDADGGRPWLENPVPASVRQIAYEVERTLVEQAPQLVNS